MVAAIRTAHMAWAEGFVPAEFTKEQAQQMVICTEPAKRIIYNHFRKKLWSHLRISDTEWAEWLSAELLIKVAISEPVVLAPVVALRELQLTVSNPTPALREPARMPKPLPPITLSAKQVLVGKLCGERPGFAKARWLIHVPEHNCVEVVDGTLDKDERIEVLKRGREVVEVSSEEARQFLLSYAGM
jgi:hypothetical protein